MASRLRPLLLLLALFAGQWLSVAHGFQHSALHAETDCVLWVQVRDLGAAPPSVGSLPPATTASDEAPAAVFHSAPRATARAMYRSRAPPQTSV